MPGQTPLITIGMPVYNGARSVEEAVRSLLVQSEERFLLHISDDGSTDETPGICQRLTDEDPRVRFERHETNIGMTGNFDRVLHAARGPFFMWAAQDDRWDPDFLSEGLRMLADQPGAIGYMPGIQLEDGDGVVIATVIPPGGLASGDPIARARAVNADGYQAIYALYRLQALLEGNRLEDVAGTDIAFVFGMALRGRYVLDTSIRSFRRVTGYQLVPGPDGRPLNQKALGASGHLYSRNPNAMCALMVRYSLDGPLPLAGKTALLIHIGVRWWLLRWRWILFSDATFLLKRSVERHEHLAASAMFTRKVFRSLRSSLRADRSSSVAERDDPGAPKSS